MEEGTPIRQPKTLRIRRQGVGVESNAVARKSTGVRVEAPAQGDGRIIVAPRLHALGSVLFDLIPAPAGGYHNRDVTWSLGVLVFVYCQHEFALIGVGLRGPITMDAHPAVVPPSRTGSQRYCALASSAAECSGGRSR